MKSCPAWPPKKIDVGEGGPRRAKAVFCTFKWAEPGGFDIIRPGSPAFARINPRPDPPFHPVARIATVPVATRRRLDDGIFVRSLRSLTANLRSPGSCASFLEFMRFMGSLFGFSRSFALVLLFQRPTPPSYHTRRRNQGAVAKSIPLSTHITLNS